MVLLDLRPTWSLTLTLTLSLTLTLTLTLTRYWTVDQPIFTAMHGLLTFVTGGIFLVYLRATVTHQPYP